MRSRARLAEVRGAVGTAGAGAAEANITCRRPGTGSTKNAVRLVFRGPASAAGPDPGLLLVHLIQSRAVVAVFFVAVLRRASQVCHAQVVVVGHEG